MLMRKNAKKFAAFTLAFGFFSSVGHGEALIKKEEQAQATTQTRAQFQDNIHRRNILLTIPLMMVGTRLEYRPITHAFLSQEQLSPNRPLHVLPSQEQFSPGFSQEQLFYALSSQEQLLESLSDTCFKKSGKK